MADRRSRSRARRAERRRAELAVRPDIERCRKGRRPQQDRRRITEVRHPAGNQVDLAGESLQAAVGPRGAHGQPADAVEFEGRRQAGAQGRPRAEHLDVPRDGDREVADDDAGGGRDLAAYVLPRGARAVGVAERARAALDGQDLPGGGECEACRRDAVRLGGHGDAEGTRGTQEGGDGQAGRGSGAAAAAAADLLRAVPGEFDGMVDGYPVTALTRRAERLGQLGALCDRQWEFDLCRSKSWPGDVQLLDETLLRPLHAGAAHRHGLERGQVIRRGARGNRRIGAGEPVVAQDQQARAEHGEGQDEPPVPKRSPRAAGGERQRRVHLGLGDLQRVAVARVPRAGRGRLLRLIDKLLRPSAVLGPGHWLAGFRGGIHAGAIRGGSRGGVGVFGTRLSVHG